MAKDGRDARKLDRSTILPPVMSGPARPPRRPPYQGPPVQHAPKGALRRGASQHGGGQAGRRRRWRYLLVIPALLGVLVGVSFVGAAMSPGNISFEAKWADWLRANHAGWLAKQFEQMYYSLKAPPKGGQPKGLNKIPGTVAAGPVSANGPSAATSPPRPATSGAKTTPRTTTAPSPTATNNPVTTTTPAPTTTARPGLAPPSPVPLVVQPALPGEGQWQPTGPLVDGVPAMYVAQFRADKIYTSEITSAVWMDPKLLRAASGRTRPT
ncbi:MAG: hypothetical protein M1435_03725 [Actinobacteria bacterium]|nr:hypothetical protein [Actinomycetota bacterium]